MYYLTNEYIHSVTDWLQAQLYLTNSRRIRTRQRLEFLVDGNVPETDVDIALENPDFFSRIMTSSYEEALKAHGNEHQNVSKIEDSIIDLKQVQFLVFMYVRRIN